MFRFFRIYKLLLCLVYIHRISGNHTVPWTAQPKVYGFGWPPFFVNVSFKTIPIQGIIQYDLLYNESACPNFLSEYNCSSVITDLSPVKSCHKVENQTNTLTKTLSCVICNSTENCKSMGISKFIDDDLCLLFKATTPMGTKPFCMERTYLDIIVFLPPKSIQLLATERKQLTLYWQHPPEIKVKFSGMMNYQLLLMLQGHDHSSICEQVRKESRYGQNGTNSHTFKDLMPWANYSVTICVGMGGLTPPVNKSTCTCGGPKYIPGGPVFQRTLPEEPSTDPMLQPCEVSCDDKYFTAILTWKASDDLKWNGIPTKSVITIWKMPRDHNKTQLGAPVTTLSVPLPADYNGSLVSYQIANFSSHFTFLGKVQFCSNGGCGPNTKGNQLSCETCELLSKPGTSSRKHLPPKSPDSYLKTVGISVVAFVASVFLIGTAIYICWTMKRKKRELRRRPPLGERVGDVTPGIYEQPNVSDFTTDNGNYSQVDISDTQSLL